MAQRFLYQSRIPALPEKVFRWHAEPGALVRLSPPWEPVEVIEAAPSVRDGARGVIRVRAGPVYMRWVFEHYGYEEGLQFCDRQLAGPFRRWEHTHRFQPDGSGGCILVDRIEYELPFGLLGEWLAGWFVRRKLNRLFEYRHRVTAEATPSMR